MAERASMEEKEKNETGKKKKEWKKKVPMRESNLRPLNLQTLCYYSITEHAH